MRKNFVAIAALLTLALLPTAAEAATRSLNLTKNVAKGAIVVDDDGQIDCGLSCTKDSGAYLLECDGEGMCIPPITSLTAHLQPGWAVKTWSQGDSGCSSVNGNVCHVTMNTEQPKEIILTLEDIQNPAAALTAPASGERVRGTAVAVSATASDNDAVQRVDFFVNGVKVASDGSAPYTGSFDSTAFFDGAATVAAQSVDPSGRASTLSQRSVTIDNTKPTISITGGTPPDAVVGPPAAATFEFAASDATSPIGALECALDQGEFAACGSTTSHTLTDLAPGAHTFHVRSRDTAGNVSDVASRSFSVDLSAPETTIDSGREDGSASTDPDATFTFSASEAGSSLACRLYVFGTTPPDFGACSGDGSHTVTGLAPGTYVFEVRATDAVGNADTTPATRTFAVNASDGGGGGDGGDGDGGGDGDDKPTTPTTPNEPTTPVTEQPMRIDADVTWEWNNLRGRTRANKLVISEIPAGATVEVRCKGKGCPFAKKAFPYKKSKLRLARALKKKRMAAGTRLEVRVVKPGAIGWVVAFKMRKKGQASFKVLCLPVGATKPTAC